ncbi:MAG: TonB-dependent receptor domain-containing protein, partial [Vulcanimicrobiaceae bacterium]
TLYAGTTGTISGTVTDSQTHQPVGSVTVEAVSPTAAYHGKTNARGFYSFIGVVPDTYIVSFQASGFQPASETGVTVNADQVETVNGLLSEALKTIGRVSARSPGGAYQPTQPQDTYTVTSQQIDTTLGRPDVISESDLLASLPGASFDSSGYPVLRGGRENEEGFEYEGIPYTDAFTSQFINSLSLDPAVGSLQLTPGAGDASSGNTGTGVINLISKRGTYPGFGSVLGVVGANNGFNHELSLEFGLASPNGRISNYFSFEGTRDAFSNFGYHANPVDVNAFYATTGQLSNDVVDNFVYKFGRDLNQSLQLWGQIQQSTFLVGPTGNTLNYKSNDPFYLGNYEFFSGLSAATIQSLLPLLPYQPSATSSLGGQAPLQYYQPNDTYKIQYTNNLNSSTFLTAKFYRTSSVVNFNFPYYSTNYVVEPGFNLDQGGQRSGGTLDIVRQLGTKNLLKVGGEYGYLYPVYNFNDPYDGFGIDTLTFGNEYDFLPATNPDCQAFATNPCGYLNSQGVMNPGTVPGILETAQTRAQAYAAYITDEFTPTSRTHIDAGVRLDGQNYRFPSTDSSLYAPAHINAAGFPLNAAGQPVTSDTQPYAINVPNGALHPLVVEPRLAIAQQLGPNDSVRASFSRSVEFPSIGAVDYNGAAGNYARFDNVAPTLAVCGVTVNLTCQSYGDELYWIAENQFLGVPYQPLLPETFTNYDFSYSHQFPGNVGIKITPFYSRGYDQSANVANPLLGPNGQPLLNPNGSIIFGPSTATNLGVEKTTGIEFLFTKEAPYGLSGQISATYINEISNVIPGSINEDFFPTIPSQSLALGNLYRVGFLSPFQATLAMQYKFHSGLRINPQIYYVRGFPVSPGLLTAAYVNGTPVNLPDTNVTDPNGATSTFNYVDPQNPGSELAPNIAATRGVAQTAAAGGAIGNAGVYTNLS